MLTQSFDFTKADAVGLAKAIKDGVLTPSEAVAEAFAAIARVNPRLNAVVHTMEAEAEAQLNDLPEGPLSGVPILLKDDCPSYAGQPMSFGCRGAKGNISETDHEIVARYRRAGLVMIGKTNLPEFSCNIATESSLHGPALNPWDVERTIGGSSGGAASAVAARMVPVAYGNDGAGSIRIPASCGGLFGLRPSRGRTPCGPVSSENWGGLVSHHVLTRSVRDSALMLDLTDGTEPGALYAASAKPGPYLEAAMRAPRRLRIGLIAETSLDVEVEEPVLRALNEAVGLLRECGHEVVSVMPDYDAPALADALMKVIATYTSMEIGEVAAAASCPIDEAHFEPVNLGFAEYAQGLSAAEVLTARNVVSATARSFGRLFQECDVALSPVLPGLPVHVGTLDVRSSDWQGFAHRVMALTAFTHPANASGIPAMSMPLWWDESGVPVGVQFMAPYGDETTLFELAGQVERERPWLHRLPAIHA